MHDLPWYRANAAECLLAAQDPSQPSGRRPLRSECRGRSARIPKTRASCPSKRRAAAGGMKLYACAAASRLHRALSTQAGQGGAAAHRGCTR